ncbi:MAG: PEP-CTERM sorting domain-containing protein [Acidobacteriota bacterium]
MKKLALIVLVISACNASPLTYSNSGVFASAVSLVDAHFAVTGAAESIPDGWYLSLYNVPQYAFYRTATFTSDRAISAWGGFFDNAPLDPGTGIAVYADGVLIDSFGRGYDFTGFWGFQQETPFTTIIIGTGVRGSNLWQEHLTLTGIVAGSARPPIIQPPPMIHTDDIPQTSSVPEPGTLDLMGLALLGIGLGRPKS